MFDGFEKAKDEQARKRWFASAGTSIIIYAIVGIALLVLVRQTVASKKEEPPIDVTFAAAEDVPEVEKPPPPPPPPKSAAPKIKKAARTSQKPPDEVPETAPEQREPTGPPRQIEAGEDVEDLFGQDGDDLGLGAGTNTETEQLPDLPPPPPPRRDDENPPEWSNDRTVIAPKARADNPRAEFPAAARKAGKAAAVVLKIRIGVTGEVTEILEVLDGEEPFVTAAVEAVKQWRYQPATRDGRAVAYVHRVRVRFELK